MSDLEDRFRYESLVEDANKNPDVLCLLRAKKMPTPASRLAVALAEKMKPWRIPADHVRALDEAFKDKNRETLYALVVCHQALTAAIAKVMLDELQRADDYTSGKLKEYNLPWWF